MLLLCHPSLTFWSLSSPKFVTPRISISSWRLSNLHISDIFIYVQRSPSMCRLHSVSPTWSTCLRNFSTSTDLRRGRKRVISGHLVELDPPFLVWWKRWSSLSWCRTKWSVRSIMWKHLRHFLLVWWTIRLRCFEFREPPRSIIIVLRRGHGVLTLRSLAASSPRGPGLAFWYVYYLHSSSKDQESGKIIY